MPIRRKIIVAILILISHQSIAQADTLKGKNFDEVVVTANKYPQKQSTTGKVITVITKEQIEKSSGKTLSQLLNEQAGITVNGALNSAGTVQTVYLRGAASGRALILLDGIPVNDPSMINNEFDLNLFSLDNIDRLEICKGAQSTLYGSDAVAGVINVITVDPNAKKPFNIKSSLSGGSQGTLKGNVQVYGKEKSLTYSARYAKLHTDGFSAAYDSSGKKFFDNDGYNGDVANAQVQWQATEHLSFKTFAMYSRYKADIDAGVFADEKDYIINNCGFTAGAGFTFKKDFVTLTGNYQYNETKRIYYNDSVYKTSTIFEDNTYYGKTQFAEIFAGINLGSGFTLLQGADYRYSSYNQHYRSITVFGPYFPAPVKDTSMSQSGLYASLNFSGEKKRLNVELGGRLNTHSRYGSNYTYTFNPSYAVTEKVRLFASAASGFKAPTLYQLSMNSKLLPEKSMNYEAGAEFRNNTFSTRLVYFNRKIKNGLDYNYVARNYFNYVKQVVNGIEYEASIKPLKVVDITFNYTYISPKETTQNRITNKDTITYNYSLRRPKHSANLNIGVQATKALYFSISGKYVSSRYDVGGYQKADVRLGDYFIAGSNASYKLNEHLTFFADAQNITNRKFVDIRGYNSIPLVYNGGLKLNW